MRKIRLMMRTVLILSFVLGLTACNLGKPPVGASGEIQQQTIVAATVMALQTAMAANVATPEAPQIQTNTPEVLPPTVTVTQTATVYIPPPTITNTPLPTYRASNVVDVNYPDGTVVQPGVTFTKTWRITNSGSGTWNANFKLIFVSGDAMGAPASKAIGKSVAPGESIDLSVTMTAPATAKTYQGKWMLQTDGGTNFGIGANGDGSFWVKVVVNVAFAVTGATVSVVPNPYAQACPGTAVVTASVTVNAPGKISYYFITSAGNSPTYELTFTAAGTQTTPGYTVPISVTGVLTASFYNDYPNHQEFGAISVPVTCTP